MLLYAIDVPDETNRKRRLKSGGNRKMNFTEGWVEYADKKVAKAVAASLNNTPIGRLSNMYFTIIFLLL